MMTEIPEVDSVADGPVSGQRRADAQRRDELAAAARAHEAVAARELIDAFVAELRFEGVRPEPLTAELLNGRRVRCGRRGWYLNRARTLAIGEEGEFLQLVTPGSWLASLRGVTVAAAQPQLTIGRGGRDGETGSLRDFLARAAEEYRGRPE